MEFEQDPDIVRLQDEHHDRLRRVKRWLIAEQPDGYEVHAWTEGGVAPPSKHKTKRLAAARILQLMGLGPVGPQSHAEEVCVGNISHDGE